MTLERTFTGGKEIILVGTAHISEESIKLVRETIEKEQPDVVGVELCAKRLMQLKMGDKWGETNVINIIKKGNAYLFLFNLLMANLQRKLGEGIGIKPGAEMLQAVDIAQEKKIPVALLDRDVQVTLRRAMSKMSFIEKVKLGWAIFMGFFGYGEEITEEKIEELKQKDVMTKLMEEMGREMPNIKEVLVDERDLFIANRILQSPGKKMVAVVGAGHLDGIKKYLDRPRDVSKISRVVKKRSYWKYLGFVIPVLFAALLVYAFFSKGLEMSLLVFGYWILINGILSAIGVLLARGHILSVLTAFAAAPFTSLHPMVAAGWFAGLTEARFNPPKVKDFEGMRNLNGFRDFYRNRVTKILLVTAYANIGSTIGTVVALPYLISILI